METHVMTREELIAKVQEVAQRRGATMLSLRQFMRASHVGTTTIETRFGTWSKLCEAAGIATCPRKVPITDEELFREMRTTFLALGGVPRFTVFIRGFKYPANVFQHRGWPWLVAKLKFRAWAEVHDPAFPYMDQLPDETAVPPRARRRRVNPMAGIHAPLGARLMGEPLGFGAMANAPVNEMGVLGLFCMVAERLGYSLELFNPRFPDLELRRRVPGNRWERLLAELEFRSSSFLAHRHDRNGCQLIVCWEADWRPNDIEVLELRSVVAALMAEDAKRRREPRRSDDADGGGDDADVGGDDAAGGDDDAAGGER
jgi:hypothetical protein